MTSIRSGTTADFLPPRSSLQSRAADASSDTAVEVSSSLRESALSLRGEIFHAFISYRVKSEADLVGELYHKLITSTKAAEIPDISRWPSKFKQPANDVASSRLHVFWDAKCLAPGVTWKDNGFVSALRVSLVFVPLLSKGVTEKWVLPVVDYVDNVLLELVLALEFNLLSGKQPSAIFPCKFIMPVFVSDVFSTLSEMSRDPALETMAEASRILGTLGMGLTRDYSPHAVLTALGAFQGVEMHVYHQKLKQQAVDVVVKEALTAVIMCIQQSSAFIDDFKVHHPRARELCDWLQANNMSSYTGVLARHGISSVYALSLLDVGSAVPVLAVDCSLSCGETPMKAITCLSRAVALAKSSELSLSLSVRLNRFIDTEASVLSALYSSCGLDTALAKKEILVLALCCSFCSACLCAFTLKIVDEPFLSVSILVNPLFWLIFSVMLLLLGAWPAAFGGSIFEIPSTEFKPRKIFAFVFLCVPCIWNIIVVYIKAAHFGGISFSHSVLCEAALRNGALTVSFDTCYLYELFVIHAVQCIAFFMSSAACLFRQELAFRVFVLTCSLSDYAFLGFNEMIIFDNQSTLRYICVTLAIALIFILLTFEGFHAYSKSKASKLLQDDDAAYKEKWKCLMEMARNDGSVGCDEANALCHYIRQSFSDVVDDPCARLFSKRPHVLQEHLSIDSLFADVERVDVAFQELVQCWLKVRRLH
jgi:hypothetical protein